MPEKHIEADKLPLVAIVGRPNVGKLLDTPRSSPT